MVSQLTYVSLMLGVGYTYQIQVWIQESSLVASHESHQQKELNFILLPLDMTIQFSYENFQSLEYERLVMGLRN